MSLFGEIVEPTSRTTWEDWDDDIAQNNSNTLSWSSDLEIPAIINKLFILEGRYLSDCIRSQSSVFLNVVNNIDGANLKLYKINSAHDSIYVCTIKDYSLLHSSEIIELLIPIINKSENVISILTKPIAEYQTMYPENKSCILRQLTTEKNNDSNIKKLEQPNIISGVSAGVINLREHQSLPATALIYYIEHSNEYMIEEINVELERQHIIKSCKGMTHNVLSSNLYI